jgi:outer membrane protein
MDKMRLLQIIFLLTFWVLAGNGLFAQSTWNLNQCISFAIKNNIGLQNMEIREQLASEELNQAKRNLLPGLSASSNAGISFGRSIDPNTNDIVTTDFFNNSYELGASLILFNGFRQINEIEYRKFRKKTYELNRLNAIDDLAFLVMNSYFDVLYHQGMLKIAGEQVKASEMNLRKMEKQVELGMKSKTDLLEMRANFETEELRRVQVENSLKTANLQLKQRMNLTGDGELILEEITGQVLLSEKQDHQTLFMAYTKWSPYYQSFEAQLEASRKALSISRSQLFPSVIAYGFMGTGFYETTKDNAGNTLGFSKQFENNRNQYIGASIKIPVFNRWESRSEVKKARLELNQAQNTVAQEKQKLYFEMANNLNELEALEKEYNQYLRQQEANQQAYQASEKRFEQGVVNVIDFYIAKNRLANSGSQVLKARLQWEIKKKVLDFYNGKRFWEE